MFELAEIGEETSLRELGRGGRCHGEEARLGRCQNQEIPGGARPLETQSTRSGQRKNCAFCCSKEESHNTNEKLIFFF